jgi:hypothetical protein
LPLSTGVARYLEPLVSASEGPDRDEAVERLAAITRRIEESKLRFSIG